MSAAARLRGWRNDDRRAGPGEVRARAQPGAPTRPGRRCWLSCVAATSTRAASLPKFSPNRGTPRRCGSMERLSQSMVSSKPCCRRRRKSGCWLPTRSGGIGRRFFQLVTPSSASCARPGGSWSPTPRPIISRGCGSSGTGDSMFPPLLGVCAKVCLSRSGHCVRALGRGTGHHSSSCQRAAPARHALSRLLSYGAYNCGYEQMRYLRSLEDAQAWLSQDFTGTAETCAAPWWRLMLQLRPDIRILIVRRPSCRVSWIAWMRLDMRRVCTWRPERAPAAVCRTDRPLSRQDRRHPERPERAVCRSWRRSDWASHLRALPAL